MLNPRKHVSVEGHEFISPKFQLTLPSINDFTVNGKTPVFELPPGKTYVEEEIFEVLNVPILIPPTATMISNDLHGTQTPIPMVLPKITFIKRGNIVFVRMPKQNFFYNGWLGFIRWDCVPVDLRPTHRAGLAQTVRYQGINDLTTAVWEVTSKSEGVGFISLFFGGSAVQDPLELFYDNLLSWEINSD